MPGPERAPLRVLIVDDEPLARQRIEDLLADQRGVEIVGTANSGDSAIAAIRELKPDLVFLDVQMPRKNGLEVARAIGPEAMPATIFVTAHDQYALQAFDVAAVGYLVKPFDDERFEQAFARARRTVDLQDFALMREQLIRVLEGETKPAAPTPDKPGAGYLERIAVEMKGKVRVVPVGQIEYITARGSYSRLHVGKEWYVIRETMQSLEERLDPARFMRVHRSVIVRLDLVGTLLRGSGGDYAVELKNGVKLQVSRSRREALERQLGITR
ncbi:MAG: LytTR family DNA-binding domain-containing protein [Gemmatimonadota bacterium]